MKISRWKKPPRKRKTSIKKPLSRILGGSIKLKSRGKSIKAMIREK